VYIEKRFAHSQASKSVLLALPLRGQYGLWTYIERVENMKID
jgi:hypothetical protein